MPATNIVKNQDYLDLAIQQYANIDTVPALVAAMAYAIDNTGTDNLTGEIDLGMPLVVGQLLVNVPDASDQTNTLALDSMSAIYQTNHDF